VHALCAVLSQQSPDLYGVACHTGLRMSATRFFQINPLNIILEAIAEAENTITDIGSALESSYIIWLLSPPYSIAVENRTRIVVISIRYMPIDSMNIFGPMESSRLSGDISAGPGITFGGSLDMLCATFCRIFAMTSESAIVTPAISGANMHAVDFMVDVIS